VTLGRALHGRGWNVRTVALTPGSGQDRLDLHALGRDALSVTTLRELRRRGREALVVAHGSRTLPACALALVGTRHGFVYRNIGDPAFWAPSGFRAFRTRLALRRARAVVALTSGSAETLRTRFGVDSTSIWVVPNGVDARDHRPADAGARVSARRHLGLPPDGRVLVVVGALTAEKGVDVAVDAMAALAGFHLVIAGDGPDRAALTIRAEQVAPDRVHFLGALRDAGVAYDAADVVVTPSRTEGLPAVLIESGLRAIPAVATDVGYVRDIIVDGETGVVVEPDDPAALARGVHRACGRASMGAAGRARCLEKFDLEAIVPRWETMLRTLARDAD